MKKNKLIDIILLILTTIMGLVLSIVAFVGIEYIQKMIFVPRNYILYTFKSPASYLVFIFEVEIIILSLTLLNKYRKSILWQWAVDIYNFTKKHAIVFASLNLLLLYISLTSVAVVTSDTIVDFSFYNPTGTTYKYNDVKDVETGFYGNKMNFLGSKKGNFYYKLRFNDNKEINFQDAVSKYEDTYTEYVVFDELIMSNNVTKISSTDNVKYVSLDKIYINRLFAVINNKN